MTAPDSTAPRRPHPAQHGAPRYAKWFRSLAEVRCPHAHRIPRHRLLQVGEYAFVHCDHRDRPHAVPCQARLLVFIVNRREKCPETGRPLQLALVVEVDPAEARHIEVAQMDWVEMMDFLQVPHALFG